MVRTSPQRRTWRTSAGRLAAAVLALGALSALAFAPNAAAAAPRQTTASEIDTAKNAELGTYLTAGTTVYTLKPSKTKCTAKCLKAWPPVLLPAGATAATAGTGVDASQLGGGCPRPPVPRSRTAARRSTGASKGARRRAR